MPRAPTAQKNKTDILPTEVLAKLSKTWAVVIPGKGSAARNDGARDLCRRLDILVFLSGLSPYPGYLILSHLDNPLHFL
jgi:hypothetical protein